MDETAKPLPSRVLPEELPPTSLPKPRTQKAGFADDADDTPFIKSPKPRRQTGLPPKLASHGAEESPESAFEDDDEIISPGTAPAQAV
jgi:hypothetical protein